MHFQSHFPHAVLFATSPLMSLGDALPHGITQPIVERLSTAFYRVAHHVHGVPALVWIAMLISCKHQQRGLVFYFPFQQ
jgi:hypothetical protein